MRRTESDDKRSLVDGGESAGRGCALWTMTTGCTGVGVSTAAMTVRGVLEVPARSAFSSLAQVAGVQQSLLCAKPIATL